MKKKLKDKYIGAGLYIFQDLSGEPMMKTTQAHLSISSIIEINKEQIISAGIQGGMGQNSLDESNMQWGTNYDGTGYNPAPSGEEGQFEAYMFGDFSAGLSWNYSSSQSNTLPKPNTGSFFAVHDDILPPCHQYRGWYRTLSTREGVQVKGCQPLVEYLNALISHRINTFSRSK